MLEKEPRFHGEVTEKSHKNMSKIRGKDTSIEIVLRKTRIIDKAIESQHYVAISRMLDITFRGRVACSSEEGF